MNRRVSEKPEKWVVVKVDNGDESFYRVFGTWAGGYINGDRWKLNSGVESVESDDDYYYFNGYSGSCYKCHKKGYGYATSYGMGIIDTMVENAHKANGVVTIMEEETEWEELNY
jgi:hypothetical protein